MVQLGDKQKNMQIGVDKGLIEMFLKMTPEERLRANDNTIRRVAGRSCGRSCEVAGRSLIY